MSLEALCSMVDPVSDATTEDCVLFLWATSPKLAEAIELIAAWRFTYRTSMVWIKDKIGMGYWARQQHELLLIATKGNPPTPSPRDRPTSVIQAARGAHSVKPLAFYEAIERMFPTLPRLELFARAPRDGWQRWGNQA
jgi:N6-adenosine-specific RNA methylase IME4